MKYQNVSCPICNSQEDYQIIYPSNFEDSDLNLKIFSARRVPDRIHYQIVRCNNCHLVRSTPTADTKTLNKLYEKSLLTYDNEIKLLKETYLKSLEPLLKELPKDSHILEVGCGNGFILEELQRKGFKNVFGVEPSKNATQKSKIKNIKTSILKESLYKKNTFDLIFFFQTFDHIPNPNSFLKTCHQILKPGGKIFAFNHNINSLSSRLFGEKSPIIDIEHTFLYSPQTIKAIFKKNKFSIEKVSLPKNYLSLRHLVWLLPLPKNIKEKILSKNHQFLNKKLSVKIGNLSIIARK